MKKLYISSAKLQRGRILVATALALLIFVFCLFFGNFEGQGRELRISESSLIEDEGDSELSTLLDSFREILPSGFSADADSAMEAISFKALLESLFGANSGLDIWKFFAMLLGISVLFSVVESYSEGLGALAISAAAVSLSVPIYKSLFGLVEAVGQTLEQGASFFSRLLPILTAITAMGGGGATALAEASGMSLSLSFVSSVVVENLLPLVNMMLAVSLVCAIGSDSVGSSVAGVVKEFFYFGLGLVTTVLGATLSFQRVLSASKDTLTMRGVKYALSGMIPVVGGTVSSALSTLISGVGMISGTVGITSAAVIISVMGAPLIQLLLYRLAFKACICYAELSGATFGKKVLSSFMGTLDLLIAVSALSCVIFLLEIILFMKYAVCRI